MTVDTFEKVNIGFDKVEKILHVADVHIRLTKRHDEYREAFAKLYAAVDNLPEKSIVAVLGDILHSKVDLSPEAVQLASEFLKGLADRRPTILIAGNHDCLLTNQARLDSLSPIVENLAHENLYYLKESKLYGVSNLLFNNMSIFDEPVSYTKVKNISKKIKSQFDCNLALFHGPVNNAKTDIGFAINNRTVTTDTFLGHDIVLLGDIHLLQTMQAYDPVEEMPIIHYAGSFIQQNHGEALKGHGYSIWDVESRTFSHTEVPNDYGYFTIQIVDGKLVTDITEMPVKAKLRVNCKESVATEVKRVITDIRKTHQISDIVYVRVDADISHSTAAAKTASNLSQIGNIDYQNKLITDLLHEKFPEIDDETLASVHAINKDLNGGISKEDQSRNIRWKPIRFEFDNMFSYGEGNVIDFTKLNDVYGLFAANASGKSSLMDALSFIIFDKSSKAFKASHVINSQKMSFKGKFQFEINKVNYFIERAGSRDKKNNVKVEVNFYKMDGDTKVPLNAEARRSTNEIIRDYLGSYDDFILTTLSLQNNRGSFVDMGQTERKELLGQFIGITLFDRLTEAANSKIKDIGGALKAFNKEDNTAQMAKMETEIELLASKVDDLEQQNDVVQSQIKDIREQINEETKLIVNLLDVPDRDLALTLRAEKSEIENKLSSAQKKMESWRLELDTEKSKLDQVVSRSDELVKMELTEKKSSLTRWQKEYEALDKRLSKIKLLVTEKLKKLEHLEQHKYDPNCVFCMNNIFVKDAIATRGSLDADKVEAVSLIEEMKSIKAELDKLEPYKPLIVEIDGIQMKVAVQKSMVARKQMEVNNASSLLDKMTARVTKIVEQLELYDRSKEIVETNSQIEKRVDALKFKLTQLENGQRTINRELLSSTGRKVSLTDQITLIKKRIEEIEHYQNEYAAYEYYLTAIGPNGLPYQIISDAIPQIESEVNNILTQIVEFTMNIETDGKNVNVYIKYEDRQWPLELCSGMEKFVAGLALRVALINISNLPRPNFLVVDEGFGALDADNMGTMHALFDFLKTNFDFIVIISHLDAMRDMVDKQLEIRKENGFSQIDNSK